MEWISSRFGVPLAPEKTVGPTTCISFLGIVIDSLAWEVRLPEDKVAALKVEVGRARRVKKLQSREVQSLLGKLNFACRVMPMGRIFSRRLASATAGVLAPHHYIRLSAEHRADLAVWGRFLEEYNGRSLLMEDAGDNFDLELFTDAAGSSGFGAFFQGQWCADRWPDKWTAEGLTKNVALLEIFPILVALHLWREELANKTIRFNCDNMGVVFAINKFSASSPPVIRVLRELVLVCLQINACVTAAHVPGVQNLIADSLSRFQWDRFRVCAPEAEASGLECPARLWNVVFRQPDH
ncbi:LOW QUALITY PROTEIN: uncharacterized protein ACNLHF_015985 [Anomaloglossus baeobatrachus]